MPWIIGGAMVGSAVIGSQLNKGGGGGYQFHSVDPMDAPGYKAYAGDIDYYREQARSGKLGEGSQTFFDAQQQKMMSKILQEQGSKRMLGGSTTANAYEAGAERLYGNLYPGLKNMEMGLHGNTIGYSRGPVDLYMQGMGMNTGGGWGGAQLGQQAYGQQMGMLGDIAGAGISAYYGNKANQALTNMPTSTINYNTYTGTGQNQGVYSQHPQGWAGPPKTTYTLS